MSPVGVLRLAIPVAVLAACVHDEAPSRPPGTALPTEEFPPPEGAMAPEFVETDPWQVQPPDAEADEGEAVEADGPRWVIPVVPVEGGLVRGTATIYEDDDERLMLNLTLRGLPRGRGRAEVIVAEACAQSARVEMADPDPVAPRLEGPHTLGVVATEAETQHGYLLTTLVPADASAKVLTLLPTKTLVVRMQDSDANGERVVACAPLALLGGVE